MLLTDFPRVTLSGSDIHGHTIIKSSIGSFCVRKFLLGACTSLVPAVHPPSSPWKWRGPGRGRAGGGAAWEAGLRRAPCVGVNVSVLHPSIVCRHHCRFCRRRCRDRRSPQPRASPLPPRTGEKQARQGGGEPASLRPAEQKPDWELSLRPTLAGRKHVPARAASCLSVGKPPLHPLTFAFTACRCPRVKTHHSPRLAAPRDQGRAGAGHAVGSGGCAASRAWHRQLRLRGSHTVEALNYEWGGRGSSPLQAR